MDLLEQLYETQNKLLRKRICRDRTKKQYDKLTLIEGYIQRLEPFPEKEAILSNLYEQCRLLEEDNTKACAEVGELTDTLLKLNHMTQDAGIFYTYIENPGGVYVWSTK